MNSEVLVFPCPTEFPVEWWPPSVDEYTEEFTTFATSIRTVRFSLPFSAFLHESVMRGSRPVLMTGLGGRVSPFVSLAMRMTGGVWAVQAPNGDTFNAMSGFQIGEFPELWGPPDTSRVRLPGFAEPASAPAWVLSFDIRTQQRASDRSRAGLVAQEVGAVLGSPWECLGAWEPFLHPWDISLLTEELKAAMPAPPVLRVSGAKGAFATVEVVRTRTGLSEHTVGGIPLDGATGPDAGVFDVAGEVLERVAGRFNPTIAFVSLSEYDRVGDGSSELVQLPRMRAMEVPVAVLIGHRAVRDLGVDVDALGRDHDVRVLGRARIPSLLVRFTGEDQNLWVQASRLVASLGAENIARAMGLGEAGS